MAGKPQHRWLPSVIVGVAFFMHGLDNTIIATAMPRMAESFGVVPVSLGIAIVSYVLSMAVFVPISGWLADRFGASHTFAAAIGIFTLASLFCGLSTDLVTLTASRVLQGVGAALMIPVGRLVVLHDIPKSDYIRAMVIVGLFPTLGLMLGPPVGGFITTYASWRWIFFINLPVGVLGVVVVLLCVENFRAAERRPLDRTGFLLTAVALSAIIYGFEGIGRGAGEFVPMAALLAGGLVVGFFAYRHARHAPHSLLDLTLLNIPTLRTNVVGGSFFRMTATGMPFLLPLLFQVVFGKSPFESGLLTVGIGCGVLSVRLAVERLVKTFGFRRGLMANSAAGILCLLLCILLEPTTPAAWIIVLLAVFGFTQGFQFTALNSLSVADVSQARMSAATALSQMFQQLGLASGVAVAASLLHASLALRGTDVLTKTDFTVAFGGLAVLGLCAFFSFARIAPDAGDELRKK